MKKILLTSACFLFCMVAAAQDISLFTCDSKEACVKVADSLLRDSKRQYKLLKAYDFSQGNNYYELLYKEVGDTIKEPLKLSVTFKIEMIGANSALEIEGTPSYKLKFITGRFLDIFPIWEKFIDPTADMEATSKSHGVRKKFDTFVLYELMPPNQYAGTKNWILSSAY